MVSRKKTVSVRLDPDAERRLEKAASLTKQSCGAFLEKAGDETARQVLRDWAVSQRRQTGASFSSLAEQTGLAVEEIIEAVASHGKQEALEMFLASCKTVAETQDNPEFLQLAREAVRIISVPPPGQK